MALHTPRGACKALPKDERHGMEGIHRPCGVQEPKDDGDGSSRHVPCHGENRNVTKRRFQGDSELGGIGFRGEDGVREPCEIQVSPSLIPFTDRPSFGTIRNEDRPIFGTISKTVKIVPVLALFTRKTSKKQVEIRIKIVPVLGHRTIGQYKSSDPHGLKAVRGRGHERLTHLRNEPVKTSLVVMPSDRALKAHPMATDKEAGSGR